MGIYWTREPVDTANTNRDGSGTIVLIGKAVSRVFIDTLVCMPLGTNVATTGAILLNNGNGTADAENTSLIHEKELAATTLGTVVSTDRVIYELGFWMEPGQELYALVHDNQDAGRQFTGFHDPSYQVY